MHNAHNRVAYEKFDFWFLSVLPELSGVFKALPLSHPLFTFNPPLWPSARLTIYDTPLRGAKAVVEVAFACASSLLMYYGAAAERRANYGCS